MGRRALNLEAHHTIHIEETHALEGSQELWEELFDGKYEWSGIGRQLRDKGLVK